MSIAVCVCLRLIVFFRVSVCVCVSWLWFVWSEAELASSPFLNFVFFFPCPLNVPWCLASVCNEFGSTEQFRRHLQVRVFKQRESDSDSYAARRRFFFFCGLYIYPQTFGLTTYFFLFEIAILRVRKRRLLTRPYPHRGRYIDTF